MKSVALCFMILCSAMQFCQAQSFRFGVKGGISIPNLKSSGDNPVSEGWSSRQGPYFGLIAELGFTKRVYLQAEINYASQGGKKNGLQAITGAEFAGYFPPGTPVPAYFYATYDNEAKLNYIELPVMVKVDFPLGEKLSLFINAGPYAGLLLNAKNITSGSSNIYADEGLTQPFLPAALSFDATTDIKDDIRQFNFGIQGGVGLNLNFANNSGLALTAGGNYGFIPIQKDKINGENKTGAATITLAYLTTF